MVLTQFNRRQIHQFTNSLNLDMNLMKLDRFYHHFIRHFLICFILFTFLIIGIFKDHNMHYSNYGLRIRKRVPLK